MKKPKREFRIVKSPKQIQIGNLWQAIALHSMQVGRNPANASLQDVSKFIGFALGLLGSLYLYPDDLHTIIEHWRPYHEAVFHCKTPVPDETVSAATNAFFDWLQQYLSDKQEELQALARAIEKEQ